MRIVISGAGGFVARLIIPALRARGHSLLLVTRDPRKLRREFPDCDVSDLDTWTQSAGQAEVFLHLAVLNNNRRENAGMFKHVNVDLTAEFATEARSLDIDRFVYVSTVKVLLDSGKSDYVDSKRQGERAARQSFGSTCEVVRIGSFYGGAYSGKLSFLNRLPSKLAKISMSILSSAIPTTRLNLLMEHIEKPGIENSRFGYVLADDKTGARVYSAWRECANFGFLFVVFLLSPLLLCLWLAIVLTEGRPGLIGQARVGKDGRVFRCWKLRTMRHGTPLQPSHEVPKNAVTFFGAFLRRLKLDELPQALNVLFREMSLIGPRPCLVTQSEVISARSAFQLAELLPGVTGWAQVNSVDMKNPASLAMLDSEYRQLRSISLDLRILHATVLGGLRKLNLGESPEVRTFP